MIIKGITYRAYLIPARSASEGYEKDKMAIPRLRFGLVKCLILKVVMS